MPKVIQSIISSDLSCVDATIAQQMRSNIVLVDQVCGAIIENGKRLRPTLVILIARMLHKFAKCHINLAVVVELIHMATLLHDDVIDSANQRHGRATLRKKFGNTMSILLGDFMYTRAIELLKPMFSCSVFEIVSNATHEIVRGEIMQLTHCNNLSLTESDYLEAIACKTASLFSAAAKSSAVLSGATSKQQQLLADYGYHLGIAFQLLDDVLDYWCEQKPSNKDLGNDWAQGKLTLPLLHTLQNANKEQTKIIRRALLTNNSRNNLNTVLPIMLQCDSLRYVQKRISLEIDQAITALQYFPNNTYRNALEQLAMLILKRAPTEHKKTIDITTIYAQTAPLN